MTKVSVFGQQSTEQPKELKKIEFVKVLNRDGVLNSPVTIPSDWKNIMLLEKKCKTLNLDLMVAWDEECLHKEKYIVLGHWNDGIV